jgi:hypothetical protein
MDGIQANTQLLRTNKDCGSLRSQILMIGSSILASTDISLIIDPNKVFSKST